MDYELKKVLDVPSEGVGHEHRNEVKEEYPEGYSDERSEVLTAQGNTHRGVTLTNVLPRWVRTVPIEGTEIGSGCLTQRGKTSG